MNYKGLKCSVCGKTFTANDDIVVCPQCGAPYHRECYEKVGKCVYADRHGTSDAWKPPQYSGENRDETKRCPRCGAPNLKTALFCAHCGQPLSGEGEPSKGNPFPYQNPNEWNNAHNTAPHEGGFPPQNGKSPSDFGFPFIFDPLGGVNPNEPIGGIPAGDVAKFVQSNTQYYIPAFMDMNRFGRSRFNFSAFFFMGIWMLYRKMYKIGAIITALQGAILIAYMFLMKYFVLPLWGKLYSAIGSSLTNYLTSEQRDALARQMSLLPTQQKLIAIAPGLFFLVALTLMLVCGFIANRMYMKSCVSHIGRIRKETTAPTEFSIRLQQEGGMNVALASSLILCFFLIYFFNLL